MMQDKTQKIKKKSYKKMSQSLRKLPKNLIQNKDGCGYCCIITSFVHRPIPWSADLALWYVYRFSHFS